MAAKIQTPKSGPCSKCPFRRQSLPGYLGEAKAEDFLGSTLADYPMPCHKSINYNDPQWREKWEQLIRSEQLHELKKAPEQKHCAGAATFFSNIAKVSRDRNRPRLKPDRENVFSSPHEFMEHHGPNNERFHDEDEDGED